MRMFGLALALLALASAAASSYEEKADQWKKMNSQATFVRTYNEQHGETLDSVRADRLYKHVLSLIDSKAARFTENPAGLPQLSYYLPITHYLSFLPDFVAEAIEALTTILRIAYYKGLEFVHDEAIELHHVAIEWLNETGTVHVMLYVCVAYMGVSFLSWIVNRFSDGLTPQARALNKETRRKAQEYLASKRD